MGRFATTASRYEHLRPPYPPEFFRTVAEKLKLTKQQSGAIERKARKPEEGSKMSVTTRIYLAFIVALGEQELFCV